MNQWLNIRQGTNVKFYNNCCDKEKEYILKREIVHQVGRKKMNLYSNGNKSEKDYRILEVINRKWDSLVSDFNEINKTLTELNYLDSKKEAIWKIWIGELQEKDIAEYIDILYYSPDELLHITEFSIEEWW